MNITLNSTDDWTNLTSIQSRQDYTNSSSVCDEFLYWNDTSWCDCTNIEILSRNISSNNNGSLCIKDPNSILDPRNQNPAFLPIIVTHAITFLVGVIGNSVVIATWSVKGKLKSPTAMFLVSLAVADLLLLIVYVPLETLEYFVITWDRGGSICKLSSYVEMLSGMASVLNLVAVSFERFLVIVFPMKARTLCTISTTRKGLIIVWSLAILLAAPVLLTKHVYSMTYFNQTTSITAYYCWDNDDGLAFDVAVYQLLVIFVLPGLFMIVCYVFVMQELWVSTNTFTKMTSTMNRTANQSTANGVKMSKTGLRIHHGNCDVHQVNPASKHHLFTKTSIKKTADNNTTSTTLNGNSKNHLNNSTIQLNHSHSHDVTQGRKQVIKMLLLIVVLFLLCWGPRLVMMVMIKIGLSQGDFTHSVYTARISFYLLSFIHSALNPFVYGFMSSNFRKMVFNSCHSCGLTARTRNEHSEGYPLTRMNTLVTQSTRITNNNSFV